MNSEKHMIKLSAIPEIPIISENTKVWFIKTSAGKHYKDFLDGKFIAIEWDKIPPKIVKSKQSKEHKLNYIKKQYPKEKNTNNILGQLERFFLEIKSGDYVLIPSKGKTKIAIGIVNNLIHCGDSKKDKNKNGGKCPYKIKRRVKWLKETEASFDIYLYKIFCVSHSVSDITKYSQTVFRNSTPLYIKNDQVNLTLTRTTDEPLSLCDSIKFYSSILSIKELVAQLFKFNDFYEFELDNKIEIKTVINSPGLIEIIQSSSPVAVATALIIYKILSNKYPGKGESYSGVPALIKSISDLFNDKTNRDYIRAQTENLNARTKRIIEENRGNVELADWNEKNKEKIKTLAELQIILQKAAEDMGIEV